MFEGQPDGATPIDPDEAADLIPGHLHTRDELNSWEQANILLASEWIRQTTRPALEESTIRAIHREMFSKTWVWAGKFRTSDKNIGDHWVDIPAAVKFLVDNGTYWLNNQTFPIDEAALRIHHGIVKIHPFPNGNGRHGRMWCDLILRQNGKEPFEWRAKHLDHAGEARRQYINALHLADGGSFEALFDLLLRDR